MAKYTRSNPGTLEPWNLGTFELDLASRYYSLTS
jgi:hypothetical protein